MFTESLHLQAYLNGTLSIHNLRPSDSGNYSCILRRALHQGMTSPSIEITVLRGVKPQIFATTGRVNVRIYIEYEGEGVQSKNLNVQ